MPRRRQRPPPRRRIGTARVSDSTSASPPSPAILSRKAVFVGPGQTMFAVTPDRETSRAIVLVNAITPLGTGVHGLQ
jgi:hypothetical protein